MSKDNTELADRLEKLEDLFINVLHEKNQPSGPFMLKSLSTVRIIRKPRKARKEGKSERARNVKREGLLKTKNKIKIKRYIQVQKTIYMLNSYQYHVLNK